MENKVRISEIAEEASTSSNKVIEKAKELGFNVKSPQSTVTESEAEEILNYIITGKSKLLKKEKTTTKKRTTTKKKTKETSTKEKKETKKTQTQTAKESKKEIKQKQEEITELKEKEAKTEIKEEQKEEKKTKELPLRRRKLKIIKKRKKEEEKKEEVETKKTPVASITDLLSEGPELKETYKPKPKKQTKKAPAKAQNQGVKIEVKKEDSEFVSSDELLDGSEVVLQEMSEVEVSKFLQENPTLKQTTARSSRPSSFINRPQSLRRTTKKKKKPKKVVEEKEITSITIPNECRVYEFAEACGKTSAEVISTLFMLGMAVTKNDFLSEDEIEILAEEYEIEVNIKDILEDVKYEEEIEQKIDESNFVERPPIITIMGHVDHGKTTLLDKIRQSNVASSEAGGITQHIGAYTITKNGKKITFIDTPGHEAFSAMRKRGASVTDIVIIVVAADDGVKPQTIESVKAAKEAGVPIIVAVNKIDKPSANPDLVKGGMAELDLTPTDWGGDTEFIEVSAKTGKGIDDLLETILLQAEIMELKADPKAPAKGIVLESEILKGRGPVATVIIQQGTLKVGDNIVADTTYGRVRAILNDSGKQVKELGLSEAGQIVGLNDIPPTGVVLAAMENANKAKEIATKRAEVARAKELSKSTKVTLEEMSSLIAEGKIKALPIILKTDTGGSLEAIKASLEVLRNDEVKVKILSAAVGGITEADLAVAESSENVIIIGFNVRPTGSVKKKAKEKGIEIKTYSIIYDLIDDIKDTLSGMMEEIVIEENTGQAEVRETFVIPKVGTVAGCKVTDGKVVRGGKARIIRDGVVIYTGEISSLKRFKDDVKEVGNGYECGIMFKNFNDIKVGDFIETFIEHREAQTID